MFVYACYELLKIWKFLPWRTTVEGPWQTRSIVSVEVVRKLVDAGSC